MSHEAENLGHGFHVGLQGAGQALVGAWMMSRQASQAAEADQAAHRARIRAAAARGTVTALRDSNERLRDRLTDATVDLIDMTEQRDELLSLLASLREDKACLTRALVKERAKNTLAA